jgi:hypothetical protein
LIVQVWDGESAVLADTSAWMSASAISSAFALSG